MLIDKYKPNDISESVFHKETLELLIKMSKDNSIPHLLFYGSEGCGKSTLIRLFLEQLYDKTINKLDEVPYKILGGSNRKKEEVIFQSNYHIVIEPKNTNYDKYIVQNVVKEYAKTKSVYVMNNNINGKLSKSFKTVLINNIDNMSKTAQASLRQTIERYNDKCRFILSCNSLSKVIDPLCSRCVCIRLKAPTDKELFSYIFDISLRENINISMKKYNDILMKSNGNIKRALYELEYLKYNYDYNPDYNKLLNKIMDYTLKGELSSIKKIRELFYNLILMDINKQIIIRDMINIISNNKTLSDKIKQKIIYSMAESEYQINKSRRNIIHYDHLIISIMKIIKDEKIDN